MQGKGRDYGVKPTLTLTLSLRERVDAGLHVLTDKIYPPCSLLDLGSGHIKHVLRAIYSCNPGQWELFKKGHTGSTCTAAKVKHPQIFLLGKWEERHHKGLYLVI